MTHLEHSDLNVEVDAGQQAHPDGSAESTEKLLTLKAAAERLGLPYWKLNRAAQQGMIPSYSLFNSRKLVRISDILQAIRNPSTS